MKKFLLLIIFFLSISNTFAVLNSKEKLAIQDTFFKYEINISKLTQNEQISKIKKLIQSIDNLSETNKVKNNTLLYDVLTELKNLAEDKYNILTQNNTSKYVESPGMKAIICEQL
jgi:hypothetical protein